MFDPFATLGFEHRFDIDSEVLERRYRELQRTLHPDRHAGASASERRLSLSRAIEVNQAYRMLKDDLRRAEVLLALRDEGLASPGASVGSARAGGPSPGGAGSGLRGADDPVDAAFLVEVMALREALDEARGTRDARRVRSLADQVGARARSTTEELDQAFHRAEDARASDATGQMARLIGRLKYFRRFAEEVAAIEEAFETDGAGVAPASNVGSGRGSGEQES